MTDLIADALINDPQFKRAKEEILALVETYKARASAIRPPQSDLKLSYEEAIKELGHLRGQELFYPYIGSGFGNGVLVELADGSVKYDFISGIGTHWGHCHPKILEASLEASLQDHCMQTNLQHNREVKELLSLLTKHSGMDHCFLTTSGAMANENGLKIIFQKKFPANRVLAFEKCFMGRTLSLAQITDKAQFREGLPQNLQVDYVPFYDWKDPQGSTSEALLCLKTHLKRYPKAHACMCFEMAQGEAGSYPGKQEFFAALMKVLKEHTIAIFVDEVQTFGRTDQLFAFQHFDLSEYVDVVSCGKLLQCGATLFRKSFCPKPWFITQTFLSSLVSIRVSIAIIKSLLEEGYLGEEGKNMQIRKYFVQHLQNLSQKYPEKVQGPFGFGLMIAFTPFDGEREKVIALAKALFEAGLIAFIGGHEPTRLRFLLPSGSITYEAIDQAMNILEKTLVSL